MRIQTFLYEYSWTFFGKKDIMTESTLSKNKFTNPIRYIKVPYLEIKSYPEINGIIL